MKFFHDKGLLFGFFQRMLVGAFFLTLFLSGTKSPALANNLDDARNKLDQACQQLANLLLQANPNQQQLDQAKRNCANAIAPFRPGIPSFIKREFNIAFNFDILLLWEAAEIDPARSHVYRTRYPQPQTDYEPGRLPGSRPGSSTAGDSQPFFDFALMGFGFSLKHDSPATVSNSIRSVGFDTPSYVTDGQSGGLSVKFNAGRLLNLASNQKLFLIGFVGRSSLDTELGQTPGTTLGNNGKTSSHTTHYGGGFGYGLNNIYLIGLAEWRKSTTDLQNYPVGYSGSYDSNGRSTDLRLGTMLPLYRAVPGGAANLPTKAQPLPPFAYGLRSLWLDISGHWGTYRQEGVNFSDVAGDARVTNYDTYGVAAKFYAPMLWNYFPWTAYVGVSYDHHANFSDTFQRPGLAFEFQEAHGFRGIDGGVIVPLWGYAKLEASAFYTESSDSSIKGINFALKVPLGQ